MKHKTIKSKADYIAYRNNLHAAGILSYVDQMGNTFTSCKECECECTHKSNGCMEGCPRADIAKKIGHKDGHNDD